MPNNHHISGPEITPPAVYFNRRNFLRTGLLAASAAATGLAYRCLNPAGGGTVDTPVLAGLIRPDAGPLTNAAADSGFHAADAPTSLSGHHPLQ